MDGQRSAAATDAISLGKRLSRLMSSSVSAAGNGGRKRNTGPRGSLVSSGFFWEISQFWQLRQRKTQPDVASENARVAGGEKKKEPFSKTKKKKKKREKKREEQ